MVTEQNPTFRIAAASLSKPGDLLVEDRLGLRRLFIGSAGTVSQGTLSEDCVATLLRSRHWQTVSDDRWYTLDDLRSRYSGEEPAQSTLAHRVAAVLSGRGGAR